MKTKRGIWRTIGVIAFILMLSCSGGGGSGGGGGGGTQATPEIAPWASVDSMLLNGINRNAAKTGWQPQLTVFNAKLYATWDEDNGTTYQIRVAVYSGSDASPSWTYVDGSGVKGINKNASAIAFHPQLTVFNSHLYATWEEYGGTTTQIRVAVYNGNDSSPSWAFVDGNGTNGINWNTARPASEPRLVVLNAKLYATWDEYNGTTGQIRVAVYNGDDVFPSWAFVDGNGTNGINKNTSSYAFSPKLAVSNSKLYATWQEENGTTGQIRVAVYNGDDSSPSWSFVDGNGTNGLNKNASNDALYSELAVSGSKLYATWNEYNGATLQIRVAVYNGNDSSPSWAFVDGNGTNGINKNSSNNAGIPELSVINSKLYATWDEDNGTAHQIRVAVYNGNDGSPSWSFVDGNGTNGINKDASNSAFEVQITTFNAKLYATWREFNNVGAQVRVAVFSGDDTSPSWTFVDRNGKNGINKIAANSADAPQLTVFNAKLYATWSEWNSALVYQIRVAVYNGSDSSPSWAFVDGNGVNGINKNVANSAAAPQLSVFNSKLYATWLEGNGSVYQVRVAVYNGNDASPSWLFVDGNGTNGINKDVTKMTKVPQLTAFNSKLYAMWQETNGTADQIRVAVYNGNDASPSWAFVDGNGANGINKNATNAANDPQLTVFNSKLYATWEETNGTAGQIRVAAYNGNDASPSWAFVDGNGANGINKNASSSALDPQLTVFGSKLYAAWREDNPKAQIRVAVYNGNDAFPSWAFVDGNGFNGINKNTAENAFSPQLTVHASKLYATWLEVNGAIYQIRVAVYNGSDGSPSWAFVDGNGANGINRDAAKMAYSPQLTEYNSKLYATWQESNGIANQIRVAVDK